MLRWLGIFALIVTSCTPHNTVVPPAPPMASSPQLRTLPYKAPPVAAAASVMQQKTMTPPPVTPPVTPTVAQSRIPLRYYNTSRDNIRMYLVSFDDRDHTLTVADQQGGPGSRWNTAEQAGSSHNGIAAINGGFFTPEGKPLGILIDSGIKRGGWNPSSLGSGIFLSSSRKSVIIRSTTYQKARNSWSPDHLLQTGPMLVENGRVVSGLSQKSRRPRSFIAWDGQHHWAIGYAEPCTLADLSRALANRSPGGFDIKVAVNLDGGRSSDLWVSSKVPAGNKTHRGFFNKPVRNYLVLKAR